MLTASRDPETIAARACGLTRVQLRQLRSLIVERGRLSWAIGDVLVAAYGSPGPAVVHSGSTRRLEALAEELGCSVGWLVACRAAAAAWPERDRRLSVAWSVQRHLAARADRFALLDRFVGRCERDRVVPSLRLLTEWLDDLDARRARGRTTGRPRVPAVDRLANMALRQLGHDELVALIERLTAALTRVHGRRLNREEEPMPDRTNITNTHAPTQGYSTTTLVSDHDRGALAHYTPCPTVTALDPNAVLSFIGPIAVTVTGINFRPSSVVYADGEALPTTYGSTTSLAASFDPTEAGVVAFTVSTNSVDSLESVPFTVTSA